MIRRKCRAKRMEKSALPLVSCNSLETLDKRNKTVSYINTNLLSRRMSVPVSATKYKALSTEDIRRSLEVLDSVLAEFDDNDIFSGTADDDDDVVDRDERLRHQHGVVANDKYDSAKNRISDNSSVLTTTKRANGDSQELQRSSSFKHVSTDGAPGQAAIQSSDECRKYSPPPVPRRSPATRLSNRDNAFFPKEDHLKDSHSSPNGLRDLVPKSSGGSDIASNSFTTLSSSSEIDPSPKNAAESRVSYLSSHDEITDEDACAFSANLSNGDDDVADDVFASTVLQESGHVVSTSSSSAVCRACGKGFVRSTFHRSLCGTKPRTETSRTSVMSDVVLRRRLDRKFEKTKQLLRLNLITGLDAKPPSCRPPPPPEPKKWVTSRTQFTRAAAGHYGSTGKDAALAGVQRTPSDHGACPIPPVVNNVVKGLCSSNNGVHIDNFSARNDAIVKELKNAATNSKARGDSTTIKTPLTENLCDSCSKRKPPVGAVSKFTSPSALQRPPLGLSYSMEDDLSPGIKEIRSSTPKPDYDPDEAESSSPKESPVVHMSTFSHSLSSLGDGSSQSDSDVSLSQESGKVPLTSIRSLTLPTDMRLGPSLFYSSEHGENKSIIKGKNFTHGCDGIIPEEMRSSSAPPPPPPNKSRWKKESKKFDKNVTTNENDFLDWARPEVDEDTVMGKPKKRGIWKSILRRK